MSKQKCACGKSGFCSKHSKIKMAVMLKEDYKTSFKNQSTVFYSFFKEEKKPQATIVIKMLQRLQKKFYKAYNCIIFYDTTTNQKIHTHKP